MHIPQYKKGYLIYFGQPGDCFIDLVLKVYPSDGLYWVENIVTVFDKSIEQERLHEDMIQYEKDSVILTKKSNAEIIKLIKLLYSN